MSVKTFVFRLWEKNVLFVLCTTSSLAISPGHCSSRIHTRRRTASCVWEINSIPLLVFLFFCFVEDFCVSWKNTVFWRCALKLRTYCVDIGGGGGRGWGRSDWVAVNLTVTLKMIESRTYHSSFSSRSRVVKSDVYLPVSRYYRNNYVGI